MAAQIAPPAKGMKPQQYYNALISQGVRPYEAYQAVQANFGPPKTPQQQAEDQAAAEQKAALGQTAGTLAGAIGVPWAIGQFTGGAEAGAVAMPEVLGGAEALGGVTEAGAGASELGAAEFLPEAGPYAIPIAAIIAAGYNLNRWSKKGKTYGPGEGLREAAKDPLNYIIPSGFIGAAFGDKDMYLKEHRRLLGLQKQGVNIPEQLLENTRLNKGRSIEELVNIEKQKEKAGQYSNVKFAESRNVADLKPEDIWGYSAFFKKYGNDWLGKFSEQQRRDIAQKALNAGAVKEHHGTIDIDWNKFDSTNQSTSVSKPTTSQPIQQQPKNRSIRDILQSNINK